MHLDFGRGFETGVCLKDFAVLVDFADVFGGHETLRYARGGAEEFVVVKFYGNVTVVGGNHALTVNSLADFANLFFDFEFVYHIYLLNNLSIIFFRFLYFIPSLRQCRVKGVILRLCRRISRKGGSPRSNYYSNIESAGFAFPGDVSLTLNMTNILAFPIGEGGGVAAGRGQNVYSFQPR